MPTLPLCHHHHLANSAIWLALPSPVCSINDLAGQITKLLGGRCKLYVTRCITRELQDLGEDFQKVCVLYALCMHMYVACACACDVHVWLCSVH